VLLKSQEPPKPLGRVERQTRRRFPGLNCVASAPCNRRPHADMMQPACSALQHDIAIQLYTASRKFPAIIPVLCVSENPPICCQPGKKQLSKLKGIRSVRRCKLSRIGFPGYHYAQGLLSTKIVIIDAFPAAPGPSNVIAGAQWLNASVHEKPVLFLSFSDSHHCTTLQRVEFSELMTMTLDKPMCRGWQW